MSDIKGNNTNSTGFQVLEFSNCSSPCPHQALLVHFGEDQRGWWILSLTLSRGCVVIPDPDPHLCGCFSWNNQIPISEQIYSVKWTFLETDKIFSKSRQRSPWNLYWLLFVWLPDFVILMEKGHSSKSGKPHQVLSQLSLHTGMGKDWTVKIEVFLLMFLFSQQGMNSTENTVKVSAPCSRAELCFTLWFYPLIDFKMLSFAASHL